MIYFIGAGPGAADLITVRGMELLKRADLVVYAGSLVNTELLDYCREDCEKLNSASMTLEEVIGAMTSYPAGSTVVRLHTGDPSIYGAIREQMDELDSLGYDYEVVPGVSSMNAAAAVLKAEYTLPGVSQTLIVSRMAGKTPVPEKENIRSLAAHGASMALFLSVSMLKKLCEELIAGGYAPETPAAVVYKATWPDQETVQGTLESLPEKAAHIGRTALVLVGGFMGGGYERSKLYDPAFSHMFREAKQ
ncbi:MAG: precorrin-4 C(11)-methyltransferase [Clostridia bacterium]|nr:precorrin-4 C(11)-methyltransferase [Clostridia bacterium]